MTKKLSKFSFFSRKLPIKNSPKPIRKTNIFFLIIPILFCSCEKNVEEDSGAIIEPLCDPTISYVTNIVPILDNSCLRCHSGNQFPNLSFYEGVRDNADIVKEQVVSRLMPIQGSLTEEEIELISCWVDNGALNN